MPYEIKVNPNYTGQTDPNCTYRWAWYVWDPADHTSYNIGDLVRETIGTSPDVSALLINTTPPSVATTYNVQLIVKENTSTAAVVCSSAIQQVVIQSTICDGVCDCTDGSTQACGDGGTQTCVNGEWGDCTGEGCTEGATRDCGLNDNGTETCTSG
jgi:hypothetical protein